MGKVTIKDVATLAGVSVGTVSMVLNNSPKVSEEKRAIVHIAIEKLSYRRNPYARSLSLSTSRTIGFLAPGFTNPFFGAMAASLQNAVSKRGYSLMLGLTDKSSEQEARLVDQFLDHGVDGLLIIPVEEPNPKLNHIYNLIKTKFPCVFISSYYKGLKKNCVMTELYEGSYLMTSYLLDHEYKSLVLVAGNPEVITFQERINGFKQAFFDRGMIAKDSQIVEASGMSFQGGYDSISKVLSTLNPDAILAINDVMAMGIISSLKASGINVPEDVAVAGFDDLSISAIQETPLTTVRQPMDEMCNKAVDLLFDLINGNPGIEEPLYIQPEIVLRKSTER